jgi:hypothetical protein
MDYTLIYVLTADGETISAYQNIVTAERDMQICRYADEQNDTQSTYDIRALPVIKEI